MRRETIVEQLEPRCASQPLSVARTAGALMFRDVLSAGALTFTGLLASRFEGERQRLIAQRALRSCALVLKGKLAATQDDRFARESPWHVAPCSSELAPCSRVSEVASDGGMSFERAMLVHRKLRHAARATAEAASSDATGVSPRSLDLFEEDFRMSDESIGAALVDVALYLFHCAHATLRRSRTPHVCLSGLVHFLEARWWRHVFEAAEHTLGLPRGSVKVSIRIDSAAAFAQAHELLYELRERALGFFPPADGQFERDAIESTTTLLAQVCAQRGAELLGTDPAARLGCTTRAERRLAVLAQHR